MTYKKGKTFLAVQKISFGNRRFFLLVVTKNVIRAHIHSHNTFFILKMLSFGMRLPNWDF